MRLFPQQHHARAMENEGMRQQLAEAQLTLAVLLAELDVKSRVGGRE